MSALHKYLHFLGVRIFYTSSYCLVTKKWIWLLLHCISTCAWWRSGSMCVRNVGKILSIRRSRDKVSPMSRRTFDSRLKWTPPTYNSKSKLKSQYTQRFNSIFFFSFFLKKSSVLHWSIYYNVHITVASASLEPSYRCWPVIYLLITQVWTIGIRMSQIIKITNHHWYPPHKKLL